MVALAATVEHGLRLIRGAGLPDDIVCFRMSTLRARDAGLRKSSIVLGDDGHLLVLRIGLVDLRLSAYILFMAAASALVLSVFREHH